MVLLGRPLSDARWESCGGDALVADVDSRGVIQIVRLSRPNTYIRPNIDCIDGASHDRTWATGHGLRLGAPDLQVRQFYGEPDSRSPSSRDGQKLELWYYAFDWAGPDVPQVMEVLCTVGQDRKPGRVVEVTLAASSL